MNLSKFSSKAFTLVEMLIVIVIIGILISALMPRLQGAQGRARDVARQADLAQIQTAIINYQTQRGYYPRGSWSDKTNLANSSSNRAATGVSVIVDKLTGLGGLNGVPKDPNLSNEVTGLGAGTVGSGEYAYLVMTKNTISNNGFVLMARVETEGGANWVYASGAANNNTAKKIIGSNGTDKIDDIKDIHLCTNFETVAAGSESNDNAGNCKYSSVAQLRYVLAF